MKWIKAALVGALAALVMFLIVRIGIATGMAPFNVSPSAAFIKSIGLPPKPLALIVHFLYAMFGSIVLVAIFDPRTNITKGIGLAMVLWLILMVIFSPIIGWGFFGAGAGTQDLPPDSPLYLASAGKYVLVTLVVHAIYGLILGWLDPLWIDFEEQPQT